MITIRALRAEDFMPWLALWQGYQRFYQTTIDDNTTGESFRRLLSRAEPMHCLVAEQDGAMVGLVHFLTHRSTWTQGDYCYLQDLYVSEAARGLGAGKALILAVYEQAEKLGCSRVYWLTQASNSKARALYDRLAQQTDFVQYRHLFDQP
ncbi:GNAT family N-acetyltransferase [Pantoea dispersa]|uniref:GNAT family N-acetyltransferase n=1 Tax=Pantoea dispersa TaxID=59814 RepID=UPI001F21A385|nr:GNAT family N-acetyltransferase [Pantoea dispersa]MCI1026707.1 GNAT family N-acetyltransferase [Pantoea dispersa]MDR6298532.1 GNAT superfamily N-acetyltransferase [Pantoea dispersa]